MKKRLGDYLKGRSENSIVDQKIGRSSINILDIKKWVDIQPMLETRLPKQILEWQPTARKGGRPKQNWQKTVNKSMSEINLNIEDCGDREKWLHRKNTINISENDVGLSGGTKSDP